MRTRATWASRPRRLRTPPRIRQLQQLGALLAGADAQRLPAEEIEWTEVVALAQSLLLLPALSGAVLRAELADRLPPGVATRLRYAYRRNTARNAALRARLETAVLAVNQNGIVPVVFKGSLYLFDGTFPDGGERTQWDLDLAVAPGELKRAVSALESVGYSVESTTSFETPHELLLRAKGGFGDLELHSSLGSPPIPEVLPLEIVRGRCTPVDIGSARALGLCPTDSVIHNVLHAQVQDLNHACAGIALRQLHTFTRLADAHADTIDWPQVRGAFAERRLTSVLDSYLYQARILLLADLPTEPRLHGAAATHHLLCLACWQLGWPTDVLRNLRYAFRREYLTAIYGQPDSGWLLPLRVGHTLRLVQTRGRAVLEQATTRRV